MNLRNELREMSNEELLEFTIAYGYYVATYWDDHEEDCFPVCMAEFLMNEWVELND